MRCSQRRKARTAAKTQHSRKQKYAPVALHHLGVVHRQPLVGVDGDAEEARVGLWGRKIYIFMYTRVCACEGKIGIVKKSE